MDPVYNTHRMSGAVRDEETTMGPRSARADVPPRPTVRVVFGGRHVRSDVHALRPGSTPVGRGVDSVLGIRIDGDPRLSREHAVLSVTGDVVSLENRSQHGTLVNGRAAQQPHVLADGDVIQLGDTFLVFRLVPADVVDVPNAAIVGLSPHAARLRSTVRLVGPTTASVLLLGPTGAGKDVLARALHEESGRRGAFVPVNATAIPETLAESQLFGHLAGSFTGAKENHPGWFRQADGGTLFLDEIGDLPLSMQPKLLRVLDERRVTPVGASQPVPVDVRLVAATNADLEARVQDGRFRADLFARLAEIAVVLPPLGARRDDVLVLLEHALPKGHPPFEPALVHALLAHPWPYNVREVMKVATELAVRGAGQASFTLGMIEERLRPRTSGPFAAGELPPSPSTPGGGSREVPVPDKEQLQELLRRHKGVIAEVARATGRSRKQVYRWLDKHGLRSTAAGTDLDDETA